MDSPRGHPARVQDFNRYILADFDGQKICVTSAHFHHRVAQRMERAIRQLKAKRVMQPWALAEVSSPFSIQICREMIARGFKVIPHLGRTLFRSKVRFLDGRKVYASSQQVLGKHNIFRILLLIFLFS